MLLAVPVIVFAMTAAIVLMKQGTEGTVAGKVSNPKEAAGAFSNEVLISIRSVKAIPSLLLLKLDQFDEKLEDILPMAKKTALGAGLGLGGIFFAIFTVMYPLGLWFGAKRLEKGDLGIDAFFQCFVCCSLYVMLLSLSVCVCTQFGVMMGAGGLGQIGPAFSDIVKAQVGANKLFAIQV